MANDPTMLKIAHFCEYCNDGTIPFGTDTYCKCCPTGPVNPQDEKPGSTGISRPGAGGDLPLPSKDRINEVKRMQKLAGLIK